MTTNQLELNLINFIIAKSKSYGQFWTASDIEKVTKEFVKTFKNKSSVELVRSLKKISFTDTILISNYPDLLKKSSLSDLAYFEKIKSDLINQLKPNANKSRIKFARQSIPSSSVYEFAGFNELRIQYSKTRTIL